MLSKRVIACLDVRDGKLAKSVKFVDTKDIGDPVEKARQYYEGGLDELVFYDITASSERRGIMLEVVERAAAQIFIPFSVGGGVRSVEDATRLRLAGAEKINVNTAAVQDPELISRVSEAIDRWLDHTVSEPAQLEPLLAPLPGELMKGTPVSDRVNSVRNDGPECIAPATPLTPEPPSPQLSLGLE